MPSAKARPPTVESRPKAARSPERPDRPGFPRPAGLPASVLLVGLAALLRVLHLAEFARLPWFHALQMDARYHAEWAQRLVQNGWSDPQPFFRAPLYPYLLSLILAVTGDLDWCARILQIILGLATVLLVHRIALRLLAPRWAFAAGLLAAVIWTPIHYETELLLEPLLTFFTTLLLFLMVRREGPPRSRELILWGLVGGLAAAVRPNVLLFLPALPLYAGWLAFSRGSRRPSAARGGSPARLFGTAVARAGAWCLLGFLVPILPIWFHNARHGDPATPLAWQGGINFYIGNNPSSNGWSAVAPGMRSDWQGGYEDAIRLAQTGSGSARPLRPSEISAYWTEQGLRFWITRPGSAIRLLWTKCLLFWSNAEIKNNEDPRYFRTTLWSLRWLPASFGLLAPLALVGLGMAWRRGLRFRLLTLFTGLWFVSVVIFFVCARYRLPITPLLPLFAVLPLEGAVGWARRRQWVLLGALIAGQAVLYPLLFTPRAETEAGGFFQSYANLGVAWSELQRWPEAEAAYQKSIALAPEYLKNYENLGLAFEKQDRFPEAEGVYRHGLAVAPRNPLLRRDLAEVLQIQGKLPEAESVAGDLVKEYPGSPELCLLLSGIEAARGERARALGTLQDLLGRAPHVVAARLEVAQLQWTAGDTSAARRTVELGLELDPGQPQLLSVAAQIAGRGMGN